MGKSLKVRRYGFAPFITAFVLFLLSKPYFVWELSRISYIWLPLSLMCCGIFAMHYRFDSKNSRSMMTYWGFVLVFVWLMSGDNIFALVLTFALVFLPFADTVFTKQVFTAFLDIVAITLALSLMSYALVLFGVSLPGHIIGPLNELKTYDYMAYPFLVMSLDFGEDLIRFHAFWDEPGCVGTYAILLLGIGGFKFKGWKNIVLWISGALSLSMFYFGILLCVVMCRLTRKNVKMIYRLIAFGVFSFFCVQLLTPDTFLNEAIGYRFEYDTTTGEFAGDNRISEDSKDFFKAMAWTSWDFYFGMTNKAKYERLTEGASSYVNAILLYGFIAFALYVSFFVISAFRNFKSKKDLLMFLFVFAGCMYQRPGVRDIIYVFIYSMWIRKAGIGEAITTETPKAQLNNIK